MNETPVIALLTDFGTSDSYVASMKGIILSIAPQSNIVDITHEIKPHNIDIAAYILWSVCKFFPKKTIFVSVVDPGVGSKRKILFMETKNYSFLLPDNGMLKFILNSEVVKNIVIVSNQKYFRNDISNTFHGRDIFAPVAAHLANGVPAKKFGPISKRIPAREPFVNVSSNKKTYKGRVLHIDRFGNIVTNFALNDIPSRKMQLRINKRIVTNYFQTYSDAPAKKTFMITSSNGLLEVSVKNGNAAHALNAIVSQQVTLKVL